MSQLKFGWAETDISPKTKISLDGEFFERVTDEIETPITVTALAIDSGEDQTVICSCDIVGITQELTDTVRKKIGNIGLDVSKILLASVHIHNSYTYRRVGPFDHICERSLQIIKSMMPENCKYIPQVTSDDAMSPDDAFDFLSDAIAKTIREAWLNRKVGGYAQGFGRAAVGMNRRVCYSDNTAKMWGDADTSTFTHLEGGNDSGIELLFIYDENKKMTGIVANIACPAQVMEQRSVISSDYWGKTKILLREKYGKDLFLLPLCSAAGDLCPRDLIRWVEPETPIKDPNVVRINPKVRDADPSMFDIKGTWKIGRRIMNEIEMALEDVHEITTDAPHIHQMKVLTLPLRKVTDKECDESLRKINEFFKGRTELDYNDSAALYVYVGNLQRRLVQEHYGTVNMELHTIRLGNVAFASNPFELFLEYGNRIRARSKAHQTFILQLTQDELAYLPTQEAEEHGHYSGYISSGYVGHEGGDFLVEATLDEIDRLFE